MWFETQSIVKKKDIIDCAYIEKLLAWPHWWLVAIYIDTLLAELSIWFSSVVIAGDKNIHMELPNDQFSIGFLELVSDHGFIEQVKGVCTHKKGGSLGVWCIKGPECGVVNVQDTVISDAYYIMTHSVA